MVQYHTTTVVGGTYRNIRTYLIYSTMMTCDMCEFIGVEMTLKRRGDGEKQCSPQSTALFCLLAASEA